MVTKNEARIPFRIATISLGAVLCVLTSSCRTEAGCFEIDGPCTSVGPSVTTFIVGLDPLTLDTSAPVNASGYRAVLSVGSTVTLYAVHNANGEVIRATDTLRTVTWTLNDATSATLTPRADGSAQLVAIKTGRVGTIAANGSAIMYACNNATLRACGSVGAIDVVVR